MKHISLDRKAIRSLVSRFGPHASPEVVREILERLDLSDTADGIIREAMNQATASASAHVELEQEDEPSANESSVSLNRQRAAAALREAIATNKAHASAAAIEAAEEMLGQLKN